MKHKTIQQLRDRIKVVLKRGRPKQLKKLKKTWHGKRLKKCWSSYASWECCTIAELKDAEGVGHRMKGGHTHNHLYNVCHRVIFRCKSARHIDRKDKECFVKVFHMNIRLNPQVLTDILTRSKKWKH